MISFTNEMIDLSKKESQRRNSYIRHHFDVNHLTPEQRDQVGFLGEFCFCEFVGIDWKKNIRENYITIDSYDVILNGKKVDVKTETVPRYRANKIINHMITDDEPYGRRLFCKSQESLLAKYDVVVFGLVIRDEMNAWYPIGYIDASRINTDYQATTRSPYGARYPIAGFPIKTSDLKPISDLL